ncbi:MAG: hypothetical protein DSY78_09140 [Chloroflexi bacterium]|nr:MAG: hypothetical protein BZY84_00935 [SAR202 cluster bacterium MP-SInd-SRR3963457-G1]PKB84287.1 MAG: hypothetical protein BZY86_08180 [SAR202 cluster bacterium MP-NPac-SRR3961935-G1]RUA30445.1 MAG: hypothetical protein DSY78_09140 [Chloroflexota bacterium]
MELVMAVDWTAKGDLFEGCNCNLLCPCHVSFRQPPTMGYCDTIWAVSFEQGSYGDVDLAGLNAAIFLHCPGNMADGDWTTVLYVDDRSSPEQDQALRAIFSGDDGGPWGVMSQFYTDGKYAAIKRVPLEMTIDGRTRTITAPDRLFLEMQTLRGGEDRQGLVTINNLRNVIHGNEHVMGLSNFNVKDETMTWEYQGKHGLYSKFDWSGG